MRYENTIKFTLLGIVGQKIDSLKYAFNIFLLKYIFCPKNYVKKKILIGPRTAWTGDFLSKSVSLKVKY